RVARGLLHEDGAVHAEGAVGGAEVRVVAVGGHGERGGRAGIEAARLRGQRRAAGGGGGGLAVHHHTGGEGGGGKRAGERDHRPGADLDALRAVDDAESAAEADRDRRHSGQVHRGDRIAAVELHARSLVAQRAGAIAVRRARLAERARVAAAAAVHV